MTYRERNFGEFLADCLLEDSPEVDIERGSWRYRTSSGRLTDDADTPLMLRLLLLLLLLRLGSQRRRDLQFITSSATESLLFIVIAKLESNAATLKTLHVEECME